MSRDFSDNKRHLPSWLRDVQLPPQPAQVDASAEQAATPGWLADATPAASEDVPDWLRDLGGSAPEAASSNTALDSLHANAPVANGSSQPADDVPDWLRASAGQQDSPPWLSGSAEATEASGSSSGVPDWLHPNAEAAGDPGSPSEAPDWMHPAPDAQTNDPEIPGWLREQMPADIVPPETPAVSALWDDDVPSATTANARASDVAPDHDELPASDDEGVPHWLRDIPMDEVRQVMADEGPEADITSTPFTFEGAASTDAPPRNDVPSWLGTLSTDAAAEAPPSWLDTLTTQPSPPSPAAPEPDMPSWLRDMGGSSPSALPANSAPTGPEQSPPDWLRDMAPPDASPAWLSDMGSVPPAAPAPNAPVGIPSWLSEAPAETSPAPQHNAAFDAPVLSDPPAMNEDVPAWLHESPNTAPASAEEAPAWLRETASGAPTPAGSSAMDEDIPAWLRESSNAPPAPTEDVPDWLRPATPAAATPNAPAEDVPDWLRPATQAATEAPSENLPPWLRDVSSTPAPAEPAPTEDIPDWLRVSEPVEQAASTPPIVPVEVLPAAPTEDIPPWLRDEAGAPLTTAQSNLPSWLRGAPTEEPPMSATPTANVLPSELPPIVDPPLPAPAWLSEAEELPTQPTESVKAAESEFLGGADLPAWLRPQEAEKPALIDAESARSLNWLTRISPAEDETQVLEDASPSSKLAMPSPPVRTVAHHQALALLERLAAEPFPEPATLPVPAPASMWQRVGMDRALYLLLLLALVLALAVPSLVASLEAPPSVLPVTASLYQKLDALTNQDVVLVGYEWDARRVSELRPLQDAVLGHLISKGVKLVLVSTDPQGTLLSYDLRYTLAAQGYTPGGSDYIVLGYKPGGELALRQLAQNFPGVLASDFQGYDANIGGLANGIGTRRPLHSLQDLSAILVLADDPVDVQGWMEQVHRSAPSVPIAFMLPEETTPVTQPYMRQPNVFSLAGKAGALSYESLRGNLGARGPALLQEAGQQRLGLLVFVVLFIIGALSVAVTNMLERRRRGL